MDEEAIGLVLARATELRLNITNSIHKATPGQNGSKSQQQGDAEEWNESEEDGDFGIYVMLSSLWNLSFLLCRPCNKTRNMKKKLHLLILRRAADYCWRN